MKTKEINQLIKILEKSKLNELSYKEEGFEISLKKGERQIVEGFKPSIEAVQEKQNNASRKSILSPLVGVYYGKASPNEAAFVKVGDTIQVGDVFCIIEAMKVMNEIKSDKAGTVKEILLEDGDAVAFDQELLVLE